MSTPAIPENIDPNAQHIELRAMQCRTCGEMGPAMDTSDKENPGHLWDGDHATSSGHHDFYAWTLTRNTAWSGTIGQLRNSKRRKH